MPPITGFPTSCASGGLKEQRDRVDAMTDEEFIADQKHQRGLD
ncbi:hypothetical protein [Microbacterium trichothecenolyticum]|nr:hypothetical protein [Microbacterium trichothecenolyticum]